MTRIQNQKALPRQRACRRLSLGVMATITLCLLGGNDLSAEPNRIHPQSDNWISSCSTGCTANYGTATEVRVRTAVWSYDVKNFRTLLQFDLSELPDDPNEIAEVTLGLYFHTWHNGDPAGRIYEVYRLTNDWTETGSTWQCRDGHADPGNRVRWDGYLTGVPAYQPGGGDFDANTVYASAEVPPVGNWMTWDVTGLVKEWVRETHDNFGLIIKDSQEYDDPNLYWTVSPLAQFRSRDYLDSALWPYLEVTLLDYRLTVTEKNGENGHVMLDPEPEDPNAPTFPAYTEVTLTAIPAEGKAFNKWVIFDPNYPGDANHAVEDTNSVTTLVMMADREVEARFKCGSGLQPLFPLLGFLLFLGVLRPARPRRGRLRGSHPQRAREHS